MTFAGNCATVVAAACKPYVVAAGSDATGAAYRREYAQAMGATRAGAAYTKPKLTEPKLN